MFKSKKAEAATILVAILLVILFFWFIGVSQRECRSNRDCGSDSYCGSDFACHQYPALTVVQYNFFWPALILGIAIIAAVWISKNGVKFALGSSKQEPSENKEQFKDIESKRFYDEYINRIKPSDQVHVQGVKKSEEEAYYKSSINTSGEGPE